MNRTDKYFRSLASAALAVVAGSGLLFSALSSAEAAPILRLTSNGESVTVVDGGAGDLSGQAGELIYSGALAGWQSNVAIGLTKPKAGNESRPILDLTSVNLSSGSGGLLTIEFTDTGFSANLDQLHWLSDIGGTTDGSVSYKVYIDESNTAFGQGELLADLGPLTDSAFSESAETTTNFGAGNDFSVTLVVTVAHSVAQFQFTSFDAITRVPEPGTLALLGIGLAGLGLLRRRRSKAAA